MYIWATDNLKLNYPAFLGLDYRIDFQMLGILNCLDSEKVFGKIYRISILEGWGVELQKWNEIRSNSSTQAF